MSPDRGDWDPLRDLVVPLAIVVMVALVAYLTGGLAIFNP